MATEAQLEVLNDAHQALLRFGDFMTCADPRGYIRASNVLLDACIDAGMPHEEPRHDAWASGRIAAWLLSAPEYCDCGAEVVASGDRCPPCVAEYRAELACMDEF